MMFKAFITLLFCLTAQSAFAEVLTCRSTDSSYNCLVCNCFFETSSESLQGKVAVAKTVLSRVASKEFPNTVCGVVFQRSQFSWTNDSNPNFFDARKPEDIKVLKDCRDASDTAMNEGANGLLYFYNPRKVTPAWASRMKKCGRVENHAFMVPNNKTCPRYLGGNSSISTPQKKSSAGGVVR